MKLECDVDFVLTTIQCVLLAVAFCVLYAQGYEVYHGALVLDQQNAWMRSQCQNHTFYIHMRMYSSVCDELLSSLDPLAKAMEAVFVYRPWLGLCLLPFTMLLSRHLWNILRYVFGVRDYINISLPR
jgi:hypothetical protein